MIDPGELLASGRAADVFDQRDGTVLRRYRTDHDSEPEAELMRWLLGMGIPVPAVHEARGRDMVMERITGRTMLEDLQARPWLAVNHIRTLAALQRSLNALEAPDWAPVDERIPPGPALLHLDLHPMNVIMSPRGPVVIDWTNARRGDPDFDAALSYVLMITFHARGVRDVMAQRLVTRLFRRFRGVGAVRRRLVDAATFRLLDRNVTVEERAGLQKLLANDDDRGGGPG